MRRSSGYFSERKEQYMKTWVDGPLILDISLNKSYSSQTMKISAKLGGEVVGIMTHGSSDTCPIDVSGVYKIYSGCPGPIVRELYRSQIERKRNSGEQEKMYQHYEKSEEHAVSFLIHVCRNSTEQMTIAVFGELTNLAVALQIAPDIANKIREVLVFDKSAALAIPVFAADPEAAQIVIRSGIPVSVVLSSGGFPEKICTQTEREAIVGKSMYLCLDKNAAAGTLIPTGKPGNIRFFVENK